MSATKRRVRLGVLTTASLLLTTGFVLAGGHTWRVNELFSNACGDIQFVELVEIGGGAGEVGVNGHNLTSNTKSYLIPGPALTPPTSFKTLLFATPACAALPGMPAPDYILPAGTVPFFSPGGDTISYVPFDSFTFGAGLCPTDGINSLARNLTTGVNSPKNYAGATGSIDVSCAVLGDVNDSGAADSQDIPAFVRVMLGTPQPGDKIGCANYCAGGLEANIAAFVDALLS